MQKDKTLNSDSVIRTYISCPEDIYFNNSISSLKPCHVFKIFTIASATRVAIIALMILQYLTFGRSISGYVDLQNFEYEYIDDKIVDWPDTYQDSVNQKFLARSKMQDQWNNVQTNTADCTENGFFSREHYNIPRWNPHMLYRTFTYLDTLYFLEIARAGYRVFKMSAFSPQLSILTSLVARLQLYTVPALHSLCIQDVLGYSALILCNICTVLGIIGLYYISLAVTKNDTFAYSVALSTISYVGNIYWTIPYTDSIFLATSVWGTYFIYIARHYVLRSSNESRQIAHSKSFVQRWLGTILFVGATLVRSNGVVLLGFLLVEPFVEILDYVLYTSIRAYHIYRTYKSGSMYSNTSNVSRIRYVLGYKSTSIPRMLLGLLYIFMYGSILLYQSICLLSVSVVHQTSLYSIHCNVPTKSAAEYWKAQQQENLIQNPIVKNQQQYLEYHRTNRVYIPSDHDGSILIPVEISKLPIYTSVNTEKHEICNSEIKEVRLTPLMKQQTLPMRQILEYIYKPLLPTLSQDTYPLYDPTTNTTQQLQPILPNFTKKKTPQGDYEEVMEILSPIPKIYTHVQRYYWGVGFQSYYKRSVVLESIRFIPLILLYFYFIYRGMYERVCKAKETVPADMLESRVSNDDRDQIETCNNLPASISTLIFIARQVGIDKPDPSLQPLLKEKFQKTYDQVRYLSLPTLVPHMILFTFMYAVNMLYAWVHIMLRFLGFSLYLHIFITIFQIALLKIKEEDKQLQARGLANEGSWYNRFTTVSISYKDAFDYNKSNCYIVLWILYSVATIQHTSAFAIGASVP